MCSVLDCIFEFYDMLYLDQRHQFCDMIYLHWWFGMLSLVCVFVCLCVSVSERERERVCV